MAEPLGIVPKSYIEEMSRADTLTPPPPLALKKIYQFHCTNLPGVKSFNQLLPIYSACHMFIAALCISHEHLWPRLPMVQQAPVSMTQYIRDYVTHVL